MADAIAQALGLDEYQEQAEPVEEIDAATRRRRRDALPEYITYIDDGCSLHPSCLTCPEVVCRYDQTFRVDRNVDRDSEIKRMASEGVKARLIAISLNISVRTVFRVLATRQ